MGLPGTCARSALPEQTPFPPGALSKKVIFSAPRARQVIVLRALRGRLLEALAAVHNGAAQLDLTRAAEPAAQLLAAPGPPGPSPDERERLLAAARAAASHCVASVATARRHSTPFLSIISLAVA